MIDRKEKEAEFFAQHEKTFSKLKLHDPFFTIKTAFFQKGKQGRHVQFFEWELNKGQDIFIEFYDYVDTENGRNMIPMYKQRQLFMLRTNPFFKEEYETKETVKSTGDSYISYLVPLAEMLVVLKDGSMISYSDFENGNYVEPQEQISLSHFPDFEKELSLDKEKETEEFSLEKIGLTDFAAIIWKKPVSDKKWLNDLITKTFN
jgi:hypothetical protein